MAGYIASDFCNILHPAAGHRPTYAFDLYDLPDELSFITIKVGVCYFAEQGTEVGEIMDITLKVDVSQVTADEQGRMATHELRHACEEAAKDYLIGRYGTCDYVEVNDWEALNERNIFNPFQ